MRKIIFVHGIFGWGEEDPLWKILPNWGMAAGDLMAYLRKEGYDVHAASVGPISGVWDRACELYAQLTGTRVDYGAAHAGRYGHARFGRTYEKALAPLWSPEHPIDFIGHSFGGTTIRLLAHLLAEGDEEEQKASPEDCSPLFSGGKASWVRTVCCVSTPHNGSSLFEAWPGYASLIEWIGVSASKVVGIADLRGIFDFKLEQFGFLKGNTEKFSDALRRVASLKLPENDWAKDDLRVDRATKLNQMIHMVPGVRYISVPGRRTRKKAHAEEEIPQLGMTAALQPTARAMGRYIHEKTPGGTVFSPVWAANDGLVNTVSARCPFGDPAREIRLGGQPVPDFWNVLTVQNWDHLEAQGGANPFRKSRIRRFYRDLAEMIEKEA